MIAKAQSEDERRPLIELQLRHEKERMDAREIFKKKRKDIQKKCIIFINQLTSTLYLK